MVPGIKKILYPTDLSETSNFVFSYAASLANRFDASITILHILKEVTGTSDNLVMNVLGENKWLEILRRNKTEVVEKVRHRLEKYCEETKAELSSCPFLMEEVMVKIGDPVAEIIQEAEKNDFDVVVMGAHGHRASANVAFGSVSRGVLRRSKTPVLVVRLPEGS